jgi:hypothetical protein
MEGSCPVPTEALSCILPAWNKETYEKTSARIFDTHTKIKIDHLLNTSLDHHC